MIALTALWDEAKAYFAAGILLLFFAVVCLWRHAVAGEKASEVKAAALQTQLSNAQADEAKLQSSIVDQNKAIDGWKAQGAAQAAQTSQAQGKASTIRADTDSQVQAALVQPAPPDPGMDLDWVVAEVSKTIPGGKK